MTRLWARLALVLAGVTAMAAAGFLVWSSESDLRGDRANWRLVDDVARRALAGAADLRSAQQAYVATGQGEDFWFARVALVDKDLDEVLTLFRTHLSSRDAIAAADEAISALQNFRQVDQRAREFTHARQLGQASDVIFSDGFDVTQKMGDAIARANAAERVAADAAEAASRRQEALALAAAGGVAALALLLLIPGARPPRHAAVMPVSSPATGERRDDIDEFRVVPRPAVTAPAVTAVTAATTKRAPVAQSHPLNLASMATLCTDLARVTDTRAIPALLERAAGILDAAGIVLWIADPDGRELAPIVVHGYPPQLAGRLGTIARDAANVTASAYRTALLQTLKADTVSNGAVAAPLVSAAGCLGVMAVEMKNGGEQREPLLAAATIIASQLSTLVGPPSARSRAEAAG